MDAYIDIAELSNKAKKINLFKMCNEIGLRYHPIARKVREQIELDVKESKLITEYLAKLRQTGVDV